MANSDALVEAEHRWGILCAKDHEAKCLTKAMQEKLNPKKTTERGPGLTVLHYRGHLSVDIIILSMGDWKQGPGPVASRAVAFILRERLGAIGMVGVCGGLNLGDVHICETCVDNNGGYVREPTRGAHDDDKLRVEYKDPGDREKAHMFVSDPAQKKAAPFSGKETPNFRLFPSSTGYEGGMYCNQTREWIRDMSSRHSRGEYPFRLSTFLCYNQVREDAYFIIDREGFGNVEKMSAIAIEMEAFGLVEAVAVCKQWYPDLGIDLFPIIKATSDTGFFDDSSPSHSRNVEIMAGAVSDYKEEKGIGQDQPLDAKDTRRAYRETAGKKAAGYMAEFLVTTITRSPDVQLDAGAAPTALGRPHASYGPAGGPAGAGYAQPGNSGNQQNAIHSFVSGGMNMNAQPK